MLRRRLLVMLLVTIAVAGACSNKEDPNVALTELLVGAPTKTLAENSSKVVVAVAVAGTTTTSYSANGEFDFKKGLGRFNLDLSKLGIKGGDGLSEVRFSGDSAFMQLGEKEWLKVDLASLGNSGINPPTAPLYYLRGATGTVRKVATETVRGDTTTRYAMTVDLDRSIADAPSGVKDDIRQTIRQLGTSELATEAWIDGQGRLRRLSYVIDLSTLARGSDSSAIGGLKAVYEYYDFGVTIEVTEPPASEVTEVGRGPRSGPAKR